MEWFKGKTKEIIALVTIVSTLAGFGYAGAGYVNRLENLEAKIGGIAAGRENLQNIEERFAGIEASVNLLSTSKTQVQDMEEAITMLRTSVSAINNTIDKNLILEVREASNEVTTIAVDVSGLQSLFTSLEKQVGRLENRIDSADDNPLLNN